MADSHKNILITPSTNTTNLPSVVFTGGENIPTTLNVLADGSLQFAHGAASADTVIKGAVAKADGLNNVNVFSVRDADNAALFEVMQNGDTVIAGVLTVNGTGESSFAGDVRIAGNLYVEGDATAQVDLTGTDLTLTGNLVVKGNTSLGDDATTDTTAIKGVTTITSKTTKALGSDAVSAFSVLDSAAAPLFEVRENGDTIIGGVLTVNGTGTSTFAGDVSIGGSLTVEESATITALMSGTDLTLSGNLIVNGDTDLGNAATDTVSIVGSIDTAVLPLTTDTYSLGSALKRWDNIYVKNVVAESSTLGGGGGGTSVAGDLIPSIDHTFDLGAPTFRFDQGYISTVNTNEFKMVTDGLINMQNAATTKVFSIVDSNATTPADLFSVMQNGDTVIAGVLTVNGTGTSTFAGDVSIGGSITVAEDATVVADFTGTNMTLTGNLIVEGNTTLGNNAAVDTTGIYGVTTIHSSVTKAVGTAVDNVFQVVDSEALPLFEVRQNGDTVIAGILTVNGTGESSFAGDVRIAGNLYVEGDATAQVDLAGTDLTLTGNLVVKGNSTLGDAATDTISIVGVVDSNVIPETDATQNLGSVSNRWNDVYVGGTLYSDDITATTVTIAGNLTVTGTTTYVNTETINLSDNVITLNANLDEATAPTQDAGININRGSAADVSLLWDETRDLWTVGTQKFEASEFIGTFSGDFDAGTEAALDARYVNVDGDSMTGNLTIAGVLSATSKSFVIDHPTKPGLKLRYGSLEGPENGVYVRGQLVGGTEIVLPDYWTGLVDAATMTVNLTANGKFQPLYVVSTAIDKVVVAADGIAAADINCFYTIFAERKDVAKLVVEYQEVG